MESSGLGLGATGCRPQDHPCEVMSRLKGVAGAQPLGKKPCKGVLRPANAKKPPRSLRVVGNFGDSCAAERNTKT